MRPKLLLFISFLFVGASVYSQSKLEMIVRQHSDILKKELIDNCVKQKTFDSIEKVGIKAFPTFMLKPDSVKESLNEDNICLVPDPNYFIISYHSKLYFLNNYVFDDPRVPLIVQGMTTDSPFQAAVCQAEKHSSAIFLLYTAGDPVVCYLENNVVHYIDADLKTYNSLKDLLSYRFGSPELFWRDLKSIMSQKQTLDNIKTLEDAKLTLRNFWWTYYYAKVYDPEMFINAVISQVELSDRITDYQRKELKKNLIDDLLKRNYLKSVFDNQIKKPGEDFVIVQAVIQITIKNTLLDQQYRNYVSNESFFRSVYNKARNIVSEHYREIEKKDFDIDKVIKKELFENKQ